MTRARVGDRTHQLIHRSETGRTFAGRPVHAARGLHEFVASLCTELLPKDSRVLELGSGSGALAARLATVGIARVTTTDLSPPSGSDIRRLTADDIRWPPDLTSFDACLAIELLEHVENPRQLLRNAWRSVRDGGILIVSTPNVTHWYSRLKFLLRGEPVLFGRSQYYTTGHITILPNWLLTEHLRVTGWEVRGVWSAGSFEQDFRGRLLSIISTLLRWSRDAGDGLCTVIVAVKSP